MRRLLPLGAVMMFAAFAPASSPTPKPAPSPTYPAIYFAEAQAEEGCVIFVFNPITRRYEMRRDADCDGYID